MNLTEAALLGLIQGLTEFLPVSSSGHLVIFQYLLGLQEPGVTLEVLLHFGTLLSVFWVFGKDFLALFSCLKEIRQRHFLFMLLIGVLITALIGFMMRSHITVLFKSPLFVGFMLLVTGVLLMIIKIIPAGDKDIEAMRPMDAVFIGFMQAFAIIPGISRSGSTILAALWRGLDRETAVRYSFMLSAPVILGLSVFEAKDIFLVGLEKKMLLNYLLGGIVSFLSGIIAIKLCIKLLLNSKFHYFAYYCWAVGLLTIIIVIF